MIEVNNLTKEKVDEKFLKKVATMVLRDERKIAKYPNINLSIALVGQERIKELNKKYRGKNKATDVLSFSYLPALLRGKALQAGGEVVICLSKVKNGELARVLIHGILHILGFGHKQMKIKEDRYLNKI